MMIFTTFLPALGIIVLLYFLVIRNIHLPSAQYGAVALLSIALMFVGGVHFAYMGIGTLLLGFLCVWFVNYKK